MQITRIEDMSIDTFPVNAHNQAQYEMCRELLLHPEYHRLVLFNLPAPEGLHLRYAMTNCWKDRVDRHSITMSEFISDLIDGIQSGISPFDTRKFEEPAVLLIDDLQQIAGKESTQETFYILLKRRLESKKITVLFSQFDMERLRPVMREELADLISAGSVEA